MDCISGSLGKRAEAGPMTSGPANCESFVSKTQMASDVSTCKQRLHRPVEPDARLQVIQILRVVTDLNDARLVYTGNASIFEMLIVNLSPLAS